MHRYTLPQDIRKAFDLAERCSVSAGRGLRDYHEKCLR
jgi:hypothetical protein